MKIFTRWQTWLSMFILIILFVAYQLFFSPQRITETEVSMGQFINEVVEHPGLENIVVKKNADILIANFDKDNLWQNSDGKKFNVVTTVYTDGYEETITQILLDEGIVLEVENDNVGGGFMSYLPTILLYVLLFGGLIFVLTRMQGGGSKVMKFGQTKAKVLGEAEKPNVTFKDVAGIDEAVHNMEEIKEFLSDPKKFQNMGARLPRGFLLVGPPGTGKTLLARATAGEAKAAFLSISASEFVEMFVGVGASRVRDLFEKARQSAPAILFIDELDAMGRSRGHGIGGGNDEKEQTLNQLLVEMDGFEDKDEVIVIAATNRPDVLDSALQRPGRFDRKVFVGKPSKQGRVEIFKVHTKGKPIADSVDLGILASETPGATGADIANIVNEAILVAVSESVSEVTMKHFEVAIDKEIAGDARPTNIMTEEEKRVVAYHETGHALVGYLLKDVGDVRKITIVPRGLSLGHTRALPVGEGENLGFKWQLFAQMVFAIGGRAAEEIINPGNPSTGAAGDIQVATQIARDMVAKYGMNEDKAGYVSYHSGDNVFLGRDLQMKIISEKSYELIDEEVRRLARQARDTAYRLINGNIEALNAMVVRLLDIETVSNEGVDEIFTGAGVRKNSFAFTKDLEVKKV